jgi:hypothetical protein
MAESVVGKSAESQQSSEAAVEMDTKDSSEATGKVVFRKRSVARGNLRKKDDPPVQNEHNNDEGDEHGINRSNLTDLKLLQSLKPHKEGISVEVLNKPSDSTTKSTAKATGSSAFASQFNSKMDYGIQTNMPHEKIMEEFIEEKLGLNRKTEVV